MFVVQTMFTILTQNLLSGLTIFSRSSSINCYSVLYLDRMQSPFYVNFSHHRISLDMCQKTTQVEITHISNKALDKQELFKVGFFQTTISLCCWSRNREILNVDREKS